jgi:hypothetical protein
MQNKINFPFQGHLIEFDSSIEYKIFDDKWFYGITFIIDGNQYEIVHNKYGFERILINHADGEVKDVPFNKDTIYLLPSSIRIREP